MEKILTVACKAAVEKAVPQAVDTAVQAAVAEERSKRIASEADRDYWKGLAQKLQSRSWLDRALFGTGGALAGAALMKIFGQ